MFTFLRHELVIQNYQNDELDPDPKISCCIRTPDKISYEISLSLAAVSPPPPLPANLQKRQVLLRKCRFFT